MQTPAKKYPLPECERNALVWNLLSSECVLLVLGVLGSMIASAITSGDLLAGITLGWAQDIANSIKGFSAQGTALGAAVVVVAMLVFMYANEFVASRTKYGRVSIQMARNDMSGELPRMGLVRLVPLMAAAGMAEELLFRFVLLGGVARVVALFAPQWIAVLFALVVSTFLFWLAHVQYRDFYSSALTLGLSLGLGLAFIATGSVALVAIAHAVYDWAECAIEGMRMVRNPNYFDGEPPQSVMLDYMDEIEDDIR